MNNNSTPLLADAAAATTNTGTRIAEDGSIYRKRVVKHKKSIAASGNSLAERIDLESKDLAESTAHRGSGGNTPTQTIHTTTNSTTINTQQHRNSASSSNSYNNHDNEIHLTDHSNLDHNNNSTAVAYNPTGETHINTRSYTINTYINPYLNFSHHLDSMGPNTHQDYISFTDTQTNKYKFSHLNIHAFHFNSFTEKLFYFFSCFYYLFSYISFAISIYILIALFQSPNQNTFTYLYLAMVCLQCLIIIYQNIRAYRIISTDYIAEVYIDRTAYHNSILFSPYKYSIFTAITDKLKRRDCIYNFAYSRLIQWKLYAIILPLQFLLTGLLILQQCLNIELFLNTEINFNCNSNSKIFYYYLFIDKILLNGIEFLLFLAAISVYIYSRDRNIPQSIRHKLYKRVQILLETAEYSSNLRNNNKNSVSAIYSNQSNIIVSIPPPPVILSPTERKKRLLSQAESTLDTNQKFEQQGETNITEDSNHENNNAAITSCTPSEKSKLLDQNQQLSTSKSISVLNESDSFDPAGLPSFHLKASPPPPNSHLAYSPPPPANHLNLPVPSQHPTNETITTSATNKKRTSSKTSNTVDTRPVLDPVIIQHDAFRCQVGIEMLKLPHSSLAEARLCKVYITAKHTLMQPQYVLSYETKKLEKKKNHENELKLNECTVYIGQAGGLFQQKKNKSKYEKQQQLSVSIVTNNGKSLDLIAQNSTDYCSFIRQLRRSEVKKIYETNEVVIEGFSKEDIDSIFFM